MFSPGRRWLTLSLMLSAGVNFVFIGWTIGGWHGQRLREQQFRPRLFIEEFTKSMSAPGVRVMTQTLADMRHHFQTTIINRENSDRALEAIIRTHPFDRDAFLVEKKAQRTRRIDAELKADQILADGIARLSDADKQLLAGHFRSNRGSPTPRM